MSMREGCCLEVLPLIESASIDAVVCDPPAGISFMGKEWDGDRGGRDRWVEWLAGVLRECLRAAKPGARLLCWAIPRTSHWTGCAVEDAGWLIEDRIAHLFGTGFPKGKGKLKPACEDWWLARKPGGKVPALNVDECRVPVAEGDWWDVPQKSLAGTSKIFASTERLHDFRSRPHLDGRYPANVTHDGSDEVLEAFAAFGERKSGGKAGAVYESAPQGVCYGKGRTWGAAGAVSDSGTAARFFYCAKASKAEREAGLEGMPEIEAGIGDDRPSGQSMQRLDGGATRRVRNTHPTVKPLALMRWLVRLITPPGGVVLDPFAGSGTTGVAAIMEGRDFVGIEKHPPYVAVARRRIAEARGPLFAREQA